MIRIVLHYKGNVSFVNTPVIMLLIQYPDYIATLCSLPCQDNEYIIPGKVSCCWTCGTCRDNEIIISNRSACEPCPAFYWPGANLTSCNEISPTYLYPSHPISTTLFVLAAFGAASSLAVIVFYANNRRHKLVMATYIPIAILILLGTFILL